MVSLNTPILNISIFNTLKSPYITLSQLWKLNKKQINLHRDHKEGIIKPQQAAQNFLAKQQYAESYMSTDGGIFMNHWSFKSLDKVSLSTHQVLLSRKRVQALLWTDNWLKKTTIKDNQFSILVKSWPWRQETVKPAGWQLLSFSPIHLTGYTVVVRQNRRQDY